MFMMLRQYNKQIIVFERTTKSNGKNYTYFKAFKSRTENANMNSMINDQQDSQLELN